MSNIELLEKTLPAAPLKLIAMESCRELGQKVNDYIVSFRSMEGGALAKKIYLKCKLQVKQLSRRLLLSPFWHRRSKRTS